MNLCSFFLNVLFNSHSDKTLFKIKNHSNHSIMVWHAAKYMSSIFEPSVTNLECWCHTLPSLRLSIKIASFVASTCHALNTTCVLAQKEPEMMHNCCQNCCNYTCTRLGHSAPMQWLLQGKSNLQLVLPIEVIFGEKNPKEPCYSISSTLDCHSHKSLLWGPRLGTVGIHNPLGVQESEKMLFVDMSGRFNASQNGCCSHMIPLKVQLKIIVLSGRDSLFVLHLYTT